MLVLLAVFASCTANLITVDPTQWTYKLTQATAGAPLWTAPVTRRIYTTTTTVPTPTRSGISVSCAREEMESFQLIVGPTTTPNMTVAFPASPSFAGLGAGSTFEVGVCSFSPVSPWGQGSYSATDFVTPLSSGATVMLSSTTPTVLFMTLYVAPGTCGKTTYSSTLTLTPFGAGAINVPLSLYVFDLLLDITPHMDTYFQSQPKMTAGSPMYTQAQLDGMHAQYVRHKLFARSAGWPAGLNFQVSWNHTSKTLKDMDNATSTQACMWANGCDVRRYGDGQGLTWRGVTFPPWLGKGASTFEAFTTEASRPGTFSGVACDTPSTGWPAAYNGWICTAAYENEWGNYMRQVRDWLAANGFNNPEYPNKGYYYTKNEPGNWKDYTISAYLCKITKQQAPGMKVMVSRQAHPWMFARADNLSCGYDIWMSHINIFPYTETWQRQAAPNLETSWFYFLDQDLGCRVPGECNGCLAPFVSQTGSNAAMNPVALNDGLNYRNIPWVAWSMRVSGFGYYKDSVIWDASGMNQPAGYQPARPRVSASLLREGIEDYEYLYQANCRQRPSVYTKNQVDNTVLSIGYSIGSWNRVDEQVAALRHELGRYLEGSRPDLPFLVQPMLFPFGSYNIDFGPANGGAPFSWNGSQWFTVPMNQRFDVATGFGWESQHMGVQNPSNNPMRPILWCQGGPNPPDTVCFDDFNHNDFFFFSLAPGTYQVTVGLGAAGMNRANDVEYIEINNVVLRNFTCSGTGLCNGLREFSATVTVKTHGPGGVLSMSVGSPYINQYTILNYLKIVGVSAATQTTTATCSAPSAPPCGSTTTGSTTSTTTSSSTSTSTSTSSSTTTGSTTSTTTGSTTSTTTGSTTSTTTPVGGGTTSPPGPCTGQVIPNSDPPKGAGIACVQCCDPPSGQTVRWQLTIQTDYDSFNCPQWLATYGASLGGQLRVCSHKRGSVIVDLQGPQGVARAVDTALAGLSNGVVSVAGVPVSNAIDTQGRALPSGSAGFPMWVIAVIICALLLVVVAIVVAIIVYKRRKHSASYYVPLKTAEVPVYEDQPFAVHDEERFAPLVAPHSTPAPSLSLTVTMQAAVRGIPQENVLGCSQGEKLFIERDDWAAPTDWVWATKQNGEAGYVPRSFCQSN